MKVWSDQGIEIDLCCWRKGVRLLCVYGGISSCSDTDLGDEPNAQDLIGSVKVMLDAYDEGRIDRFMWSK